MARATRWIGAAGLTAMVVGCQASPIEREPLLLIQTPPPVQAAWTDVYRANPIRSITRETHAGDAYYTFDYATPDGAKHTVVFNGAGNEIDKH